MVELIKCEECGSVEIEYTEIAEVIFTWRQDEEGIDPTPDDDYVDVEEDTKYANIECYCMNCDHEWVIYNKDVAGLPGWLG